MADQSTRKLCDLRVIDLRNELEKRGLEKNGIKQALYDRLETWLIQKGHNPKTYTFEHLGSNTPNSTKRLELSQELDVDADMNINNQISIRIEEDLQDNLELLEQNCTTAAATTTVAADMEGGGGREEGGRMDEQCNIISIDMDEDTKPFQCKKQEGVKQQKEQQQEEQQQQQQQQQQKQEEEEEEEEDLSRTHSKDQTSSCNMTVQTSKGVADGGHNLWISGLSCTTRAADLKNIFSKHGKVTGAKVVTNAKSPGSKCYGYVSMSSADEASSSIKHLNHTELHGRIISVEKAKVEPSMNVSSKASVKAADEAVKTTSITAKTSTSTTTITATSTRKNEEGEERKESGNRGEKRKEEWEKKREGGEKRREAWRGAPRNKFPYRRPVTSNFRGRRDHSNILTLEKIREVRERERQRERERLCREEERRQQLMLAREKERQRHVERMQREEAVRLMREKEKLRLEKQRLEYDKVLAEREKISLEREKQRRERERLQKERDERRKEVMISERKRKHGEEWEGDKRKTSSFSYVSGSYRGSKASPDKKHQEHKDTARSESKSDKRSRLEWRAVNKSERQERTSRTSANDVQQPSGNYHFQTAAWPSSSRSQMTSWTTSPFNCPPAPNGAFNSSTRYQQAHRRRY